MRRETPPVKPDVKKNQLYHMDPFIRTHWNKLAWGKEFTREDDGEYRNKLRSDMFRDEMQPENKPNGRIKRITVRLKMEAEDWYQETGHEIFIGTASGYCTAKEERRFVTSTKHNQPEEEEQDQIDTWQIRMDAVEPKKGQTHMDIQVGAINSNMNGSPGGAQISTIELEPRLGTPRNWQGVAVRASEWAITGSLIGAQVEVSGRAAAGPITRTMYNGPATISEITIKDPQRTGTAKWKVIDREAQESGIWIRQDIPMAWREGSEPKQPGLEEKPTICKRQQTGPFPWANFMKCPRAAYHSVETKDELGHDLWGGDLSREREKWQR
jgi:hypothetical protein